MIDTVSDRADAKDTRMNSATSRNALVIIAVILAGAALHWLADIITPLLLAVFLYVMIDGLARTIRSRLPGFPAAAATAAAIGLTLSLLAVSIIIVATNANGFVTTLTGAVPKITHLVEHLAAVMPFAGPDGLHRVLGEIPVGALLGRLAGSFQGFAGNALWVLIYLGFLIAARGALERKAARLFVSPDSRRDAGRIFLSVRSGVQQYLWLQSINGALMAGGSFTLMTVFGLDNATFWAFTIFIASFVPFVGGAIGIALPALFGLLQFDDLWRYGGLFTGLWLLHTLVGSILMPRLQGQKLNMDPLVVLLSLAFWGAILGVAGLFLSTPMTVLSMAILAQFPGSRWIAVLLSADGELIGAGDTAGAMSEVEV